MTMSKLKKTYAVCFFDQTVLRIRSSYVCFYHVFNMRFSPPNFGNLLPTEFQSPTKYTCSFLNQRICDFFPFQFPRSHDRHSHRSISILLHLCYISTYLTLLHASMLHLHFSTVSISPPPHLLRFTMQDLQNFSLPTIPKPSLSEPPLKTLSACFFLYFVAIRFRSNLLRDRARHRRPQQLAHTGRCCTG
jgi:hypothetical protein